ncbi:MAG: DotU family type IV/VI secretion system protein [Succinivibrionaceae bacterium]|nr:DotU family type IV/VI secretion system protein [Succinivibrionaceae bacterium]
MVSDLERLVEPLLTKICYYFYFARSGNEPEHRFVMSNISDELENIARKCRDNPSLRLQYSVVERPVIFFLDYTLKEAGFSFSREHRELARDFNELSGDEKFFDLLDDCLERNDDPDVLRLFYTMLGLGFDGCFKRERQTVLSYMQKCAERLRIVADGRHLTLSGEAPNAITSDTRGNELLRFLLSRKMVLACAAVLALSLAINFISLKSYTDPLNDSINEMVSSAHHVTLLKNQEAAGAGASSGNE